MAIDLISRKALIEAYDKAHKGPPGGARKLMEEAPSVEAVPVVHGEWVAVPSSDMMTGKAYKCSECKTMRYGSYMPNYCSNCGAKMDGGKEK